MADHDQNNDEYHFTDLDQDSPFAEEDPKADALESTNNGLDNAFEMDKVKRNAIIAVVSLVLLIGLYGVVNAFLAKRKNQVATDSMPKIIETRASPKTIAVPTTTVAPLPTAPVDSNIEQKLSDLESSQQSMRTDVSSVNTQLTGISTNVNAIAQQMAQLNAVIASLSSKVDEQSHEIEQLTIKHEAKQVHHPAHRKNAKPLRYFIQAVIPGRAWLIATNGSTLTVREGTAIAGYGLVRLIDPEQGRIMTSSGQVIKFSQEDS